VLFIITFISIIIYGLLSEINWMDGWMKAVTLNNALDYRANGLLSDGRKGYRAEELTDWG